MGRTEQQLKAAGIDVPRGQFPFMVNGRARALGDARGFVKILADAKTDRVLGMHIDRPARLGADRRGRRGDGIRRRRARTSRASATRHPSLSEVTKEAALAVDKRSLNYVADVLVRS